MSNVDENESAVIKSSIAIRKIPPEVISKLCHLAEIHDRSLEAEARFALRMWALQGETQMAGVDCLAEFLISTPRPISSIQAALAHMEAIDFPSDGQYKVCVRVEKSAI